MSVFLDKTVENNVQLLPLASTVSSCATVAMTIVTLRLDVNVECQVQSNLFLLRYQLIYCDYQYYLQILFYNIPITLFHCIL